MDVPCVPTESGAGWMKMTCAPMQAHSAAAHLGIEMGILFAIVPCAIYLGYQWCQDQVVCRLEHELSRTYLFQKRNERGQFVK